MIDFPSKALYETFRVTFDFADQLAPGETILTAPVSVYVYSGTDATPQTVAKGSSRIEGSQVTQLLGGGVLGTVYQITCTATTSEDRVFSRSGTLAVAADWGDPDLANAPTVDFSADPLLAYPPGTVQFTDLSTHNPTAWLWTVTAEGEDTVISHSQNPVMILDSGAWTVQLEASNIYGTGSELKVDYITIVDPLSLELSSYTVSASGDINDPTVTTAAVTALPSGGIPGYTYLWEYVSGDSFTFGESATGASMTFVSTQPEDNVTYVGTYRCTVTDTTSHSASAEVEVTINWVLGITYITFDPASPYLNGWVLSNSNRTGTLGNANLPNTAAPTYPICEVVPGRVRAVAFKINSIGPMTADKGYGVAIGSARLVNTYTDILYIKAASVGARFILAAIARQSGGAVNIAAPDLVANDEIGFTFDVGAANYVLNVYHNGVLAAGPYTLSTIFSAGGSGSGLNAGAETNGGLGTNAISVTMLRKPSEMVYWANYGATTGWWV